MGSFTRVPLDAEEIYQVLTRCGDRLSLQQRTLFEYLAQNDIDRSVPSGRVAELLQQRKVVQGRIQPTLRGSLSAAINFLNRILREKFPERKIVFYATSPNGTFYWIYRITKNDARSGVAVKVQRANIEHGLKNCRQFGCVIKRCKERHRCEFAESLVAIGGDPKHYRVTKREKTAWDE